MGSRAPPLHAFLFHWRHFSSTGEISRFAVFSVVLFCLDLCVISVLDVQKFHCVSASLCMIYCT